MHEHTKHNYRLTAILISTIAAGLPLWTNDIRRIDFSETSFIVTWIAIGIAATLVVRFVVNLKVREMIGCFAIGYVLALVIHFVGRIMISSYVQTRFEVSLLIAILAGVLSGWIGSLLWTGIKKSVKR